MNCALYIPYRYGFNGKEKDDEGMGGGGSTYDYGFRIYNPQIAKFLSVDPLTKSFPWYTPYQFAGNKPIIAIDLDGLEEKIVIRWMDNDKCIGILIVRVPKADYIKAVNSDYNKANQQIESDPYMSKKDKKDGIAYNESQRAKSLKEVDDNYSKTLYVDYQAKPASLKNVQKFADETDFSRFSNGKPLSSSDFLNSVTGKLGGLQGMIDFTKCISTNSICFFEAQTPSVFNYTFNTGSFELSDEAKGQLQNLALIMSLSPEMNIGLVGHTDNVGDEGSNLGLSINRAKSSRDYLISLGIDGSRISASGEGQSKPIVPNNSSGGTVQNRRIDVIQN